MEIREIIRVNPMMRITYSALMIAFVFLTTIVFSLYIPATEGFFNFTNMPSGTYGMFIGLFNPTTMTNSFVELFHGNDFLDVYGKLDVNVSFYDNTVLNITIEGMAEKDPLKVSKWLKTDLVDSTDFVIGVMRSIHIKEEGK